METKPLAALAINTRLKLLRSTEVKIAQALESNSQERLEKPLAVSLLEEDLKVKTIEQVSSEVSYVWFNRLLALTMLDAIGFNTPSVVTPVRGAVYPEVLQEAQAGRMSSEIFSTEAVARVTGILNGSIPSLNPDAEAYALLLQEVCRSWGDRFPMIFQASSEIVELLTPSDLLSADSTRADMVKVIKDDYSTDIETIGWLFQFYNSEVKDSAFSKFKSGKKASHEDLVAATQIFTPRNIAQSMVQNTIGSLWARMHPNSLLAKSLPPVAILESPCPQVLQPQQLTVLDPAVGSGNLLLSAFDFLERAYLESGYSQESTPGLILEHNLHGIDIDPRAAALASFALWLRASKSLSKALALKLPQPKITVLSDNPLLLGIADECEDPAMRKRITALASAGTIGSLVRVKEADLEYLAEKAGSAGVLGQSIDVAVTVATPLSKRYTVVLANPPYMGPKNMPPTLKAYVEENYADGKADLYGAFLVRAINLTNREGRSGLITQSAWLTLKRFETLRRWFYQTAKDSTFIRTDSNVFFGVGGFIDKVLSFASHEGGVPARVLGFSKNSRSFTKEDLKKFEVISGLPFAFGVPTHILAEFSNSPRLASLVKSNKGTATGENELFLRYWWEVDPRKISTTLGNEERKPGYKPKWFPHTKGGAPLKWYGNMLHVINWEENGKEVRTGLKANGTRRFFQIMSEELAFRPYICWSYVSRSPAFRLTPNGHMTDSAAPALIGENMYGLLAFLNSTAASALIKTLNPTLKIQIGDVEALPVLTNLDSLAELGKRAVDLAKVLWDSNEVSMEFDYSSQLAWLTSGIQNFETELQNLLDNTSSEIQKIQEKIDSIVSSDYGYPWGPEDSYDSNGLNEQSGSEYETEEVLITLGSTSSALSLLAGLQLGHNRVPATVQMEACPDEDNIIPIMLADFFGDDFSSRLPKIIDDLTGGKSAENMNWLSARLGTSVRQYMRKDFYPHHLKVYRGCPIYWVIKSPKGTFQALTYIHRFSIDTLAACRSKYVKPLVEKLQTHQRAVATTDPKKAASLESEIQDLQELDKRLYDLVVSPPLIDFDEGVVKNHARFASVLQKIK